MDNSLLIDECEEMIRLYIEAEKAVLTGKKYRLGSRELEREDLNNIIKARKDWEQRLKDLKKGGKTRKVRGVVIRDL